MESSKKIQGKITDFGKRIIKVLEINNLIKANGEVNYSEAERLCEIKQSALSKAVKAKGMHDGNLEKFLGKFHVQREWLLHGIGEMLESNIEENSTYVELLKQKDPNKEVEILREMVLRLGETNTYLLKRIKELEG